MQSPTAHQQPRLEAGCEGATVVVLLLDRNTAGRGIWVLALDADQHNVCRATAGHV